MIQQESFQLIDAAAGTYPLTVLGGLYQLAATATWNSGSLKLNQILPDGSTALQLYGQPSTATPTTWIESLAANGVIYFYLPPGAYQLVFATGSALYANLTRIPLQ